MRNRPWMVAIVAFVVVLGFGGFALAAPGIFGDGEPDPPALIGEENAVSDEVPVVPEAPAPKEAYEPAEDDEKVAPPIEEVQTEPPITEVAEPPEEPKAEPPEEAAAEKAQPLFLTITAPAEGEHVTEKVITFAGTTLPGAAVVSASGYEADVDEAGNWSIVLVLSPGGNKATFVAEAPDGQRAEAAVVVSYDPPAGDSGIAFTAQRKYGECSAIPPYDKYFGTAPPGTKITITSAHGSGSGYSGDNGEYWIKVHFPDAPYGEPFPVTVTDGTTSYEFAFTSWAPSLDDLEFTAHQVYGSSEADPPYDKFEGTAPPGTAILVTSPYGSGDGYAGDWGEYRIKVHFPEAPYGEPFPVTVTDGSTTFEFTFTSYAVPPEDKPFTANQKHGESSDSPPWDKFWGTAPAGATVVVASEYGSAEGTADAAGNWLIEIAFHQPPYGEAFPVTVSSGGETITFTFTSFTSGGEA